MFEKNQNWKLFLRLCNCALRIFVSVSPRHVGRRHLGSYYQVLTYTKLTTLSGPEIESRTSIFMTYFFFLHIKSYHNLFWNTSLMSFDIDK